MQVKLDLWKARQKKLTQLKEFPKADEHGVKKLERKTEK